MLDVTAGLHQVEQLPLQMVNLIDEWLAGAKGGRNDVPGVGERHTGMTITSALNPARRIIAALALAVTVLGIGSVVAEQQVGGHNTTEVAAVRCWSRYGC
jgi:hypothetical protein